MTTNEDARARMMINEKPWILFAMPDDSPRKVLLEAFQEHECPFQFEMVSTAGEARNLLSQRNFQAVVMTKSIALSGDDATIGLITSQEILPPTITVLHREDGYPDYLYTALTNNDWITVPFDIQEFYNRVLTIISRIKDSRGIEISTKIQLIATLKDSNHRVINWFTGFAIVDFFTRHGDVWSASDNLDHLIKSHKPISLALKLPKLTLQGLFGKLDRRQMSYEELCRFYRDELAQGAQASGRYVPNQENPAEQAEERKTALLAQFSKASAELVSALEKWDEKELDRYLLPHPILGKLTVREMIFFTIYHNLRHASQEGD